ncbi:MAG: ABC transporter substrate-binding protein [Clostridiales bacterium]|jgi:peptide/nickel transport system substrate-binding protein|nr:ABC transporter substrate-binding protein [Clostridiales bacterium]
MKNLRSIAICLFSVAILFTGCYKKADVENSSTSNASAVPAITPASSTDEAESNSAIGSSDELAVPKEMPEITVLFNGNQEMSVVLQDLLEKAGFKVAVDIQPDNASFYTKVDAGNFDLAFTYWTTTIGSPDYSVRSVWHSDGSRNSYHINDPKLDELIELGASQTPEEYISTYSEIEDYMIGEMAYAAPVDIQMKDITLNASILDPESVRNPKSRAFQWEVLRYNDPSQHETLPFLMSQVAADLSPMDPIRADNSTFQFNTNCYIRLVNLTDSDEITTDASLAYDYAIGDSGSDFYFLLRDDVFFSKVENGHAVNTGERVGAEDAVYSLDRAKDKNSVPNHPNYSQYDSIDKNEVFTDLDSLKSIPSKTGGKSVYDVLQEAAPSAIASLTDDKSAANNSGGVYQIVHTSTKYPFPQILNVLAHTSSGVLSKDQVEKVNAKYISDPDSYNVQTDALYGEQSWYIEGEGYDNNLVCSGPYIPIKKNDYQCIFELNPGFMPTDETYAPKIKTIDYKFIKDAETAFSALRAGEIHVLYTISASKFDILNSDPTFMTKDTPSNIYHYLAYNYNGVFSNINLRKAVQHAIDQELVALAFQGRRVPTYSPITSVLSTGKVLKADPDMVAYYLSEWAKETGN